MDHAWSNQQADSHVCVVQCAVALQVPDDGLSVMNPCLLDDCSPSLVDMFSYYGIAVSGPLTLLNYFLLGLSSSIDRFYWGSFQIFVSVVLVFPILGNLSFTALEYRLGQRSLFASFWENVKWVPFLCALFFFVAVSE